ncbi:MAG TPA: hypothetical protein VFP52_04785 [Myxococcales bacterium]|nr:hypothetical protein [Myxococcales bacterium]
MRFDQPAAVHVTMRVALHVWNLRSRRCFRLIEIALADARGRFGLRVVEFSVLGNHLHLVVEADSSAALSRGMQGLSIRIAKALNRLMRRRGSVFADHYHPRILRSPTELVGAIAYVLGNAQHHYGISGPDPYSSATCNRQRLLSHPAKLAPPHRLAPRPHPATVAHLRGSTRFALTSGGSTHGRAAALGLVLDLENDGKVEFDRVNWSGIGLFVIGAAILLVRGVRRFFARR